MPVFQSSNEGLDSHSLSINDYKGCDEFIKNIDFNTVDKKVILTNFNVFSPNEDEIIQKTVFLFPKEFNI